MRLIAVTQRVDEAPVAADAIERRDALDQRWVAFLAAAGCLASPLPNAPDAALALFAELPFDGLLLTGGNDLAACGGGAPERDATEFALLAAARTRGLPVIGVCRGMQVLQVAFGAQLEPVHGHVRDRQEILVEGRPTRVNSYHRWGAQRTAPDLAVWARSQDGVIKAVRHRCEPLVGLMWHPERMQPFRADDLALVADLFAARAEAAA
jgi:putative glutamine amidotransferase